MLWQDRRWPTEVVLSSAYWSVWAWAAYYCSRCCRYWAIDGASNWLCLHPETYRPLSSWASDCRKPSLALERPPSASTSCEEPTSTAESERSARRHWQKFRMNEKEQRSKTCLLAGCPIWYGYVLFRPRQWTDVYSSTSRMNDGRWPKNGAGDLAYFIWWTIYACPTAEDERIHDKAAEKHFSLLNRRRRPVPAELQGSIQNG